MANYRRAQVPGGVFFFTVVTRQRRSLLAAPEAALRDAIRTVKRQRPFVIDALVVLPGHLHCILRLPADDSDFSSRWREIKKATSRAIGCKSNSGKTNPLWQPRFWEHAIRDDRDWRRHMDYIHYNPVKHGLAGKPGDWPWSSFHRCVERGLYPPK